MVLTVPGRSIDREDVRYLLSGIDFLAYQRRLVLVAAKPRHDHQRYALLGGCGYHSPPFVRRLRREALHAPYEIRPDVHEVFGLVETRRASALAIIRGNPEFVVNFAKDALSLTIFVAMPMLGLGLLVGLTVSVFQATTSIQEMTLTFVPKILAVLLGLLYFAPWMLDKLITFTQNIFQNIPLYIR